MSSFPPEGFRLEILKRDHKRKRFDSGEARVDAWLHQKALSSMSKNVSTTRVLVEGEEIAGFYTLANTALDVSLVPPDLLGGQPALRPPPTITLAWLGVDRRFAKRGFGTRLFARALADCAGVFQLVRFSAVIVDALSEENHQFYAAHGFTPVPGTTHKLYLSASTLLELVAE